MALETNDTGNNSVEKNPAFGKQEAINDVHEIGLEMAPKIGAWLAELANALHADAYGQMDVKAGDRGAVIGPGQKVILLFVGRQQNDYGEPSIIVPV